MTPLSFLVLFHMDIDILWSRPAHKVNAVPKGLGVKSRTCHCLTNLGHGDGDAVG